MQTQLIIRTFNISNLHFSLPHLVGYESSNVIIHNDNPSVKVAEDLIKSIVPTLENYTIVNEKENVGMFMSTFNCIKYLDRSIPYTVLLDDDDIAIPIKNIDECTAMINKPKRANMFSNEDYTKYINHGEYGKTYYGLYHLACYWNTDFLIDLFAAIDSFMDEFSKIWDGTYINGNEDAVLYKMAEVFYQQSKYCNYDFTKELDELGLIYNMTIPPNKKKYLVDDFCYNPPKNANELRWKFHQNLRATVKEFKKFLEEK